MFEYITKYSFIIFTTYEIITIEVIQTKLIDIILDKLIYIIFGILFYILGYFTSSFCKKYSKEEEEILKFMNAGDKMNKKGSLEGLKYYSSARVLIDRSIPFTDISPNILKKMDKIEYEYKMFKYKEKKKKKRAD
jgi:hypothetical protein